MMFDDYNEVWPIGLAVMAVGVTMYMVHRIQAQKELNIVFIFSSMGSLNHFLDMAKQQEKAHKCRYQWVPCNAMMLDEVSRKLRDLPDHQYQEHHVMAPYALLTEAVSQPCQVIAGVPSDSSAIDTSDSRNPCTLAEKFLHLNQNAKLMVFDDFLFSLDKDPKPSSIKILARSHGERFHLALSHSGALDSYPDPDMPISLVGHLSFRASPSESLNQSVEEIRKTLCLSNNEKIILFSVTTQSSMTDLRLLGKLLKAMPDDGQYAIVICLHPERQYDPIYLAHLYNQMPEKFKKKTLRIILPQSDRHVSVVGIDACLPFVYSTLRCGDLESVAFAYAQSSPGALINKGALKGTPTLIDESPMRPFLNGARNVDPHRLFRPSNDPAVFESEVLPEGDVGKNLWKVVLS